MAFKRQEDSFIPKAKPAYGKAKRAYGEAYTKVKNEQDKVPYSKSKENLKKAGDDFKLARKAANNPTGIKTPGKKQTDYSPRVKAMAKKAEAKRKGSKEYEKVGGYGNKNKSKLLK